MAKLWQFLQGHPKPEFSVKVQTRDQGKFFKIRPKRSPRFKKPRGLWRKWIILWLLCAQRAKSREGFGANSGFKSARMAKLGQFLQNHPKPEFSVKVQRGDQGKFFKYRPKRRPRLKGPNALWRKWHYHLICMHLKCKPCKTFWRKQRLQKSPIGQVMAIFARSPKTRIFCKIAKGRPRKIFQKSPKK